MTDKPVKKSPPADLAYGVKRAPGGWKAYEARIVDGRLTSTRWLCESATLGEAMFHVNQAFRKDWPEYFG